MIARCWVGNCDWNAADSDPVELTAKAELHRLERHDWVAPGKVHRLELDRWELERVAVLVEERTRQVVSKLSADLRALQTHGSRAD